MLKVCAVVALVLVTSDLNGQTICNTSTAPLAVARQPFQVRRTLPAQPAGSGAARTTKERIETLLTVPDFRFAVIDSIAVKGTQPVEGYLALELRTAALNERSQPDWARHFLYAREGVSQDARAVHVRETLKLYAASRSRVDFGIQSSTSAAVDPIAVTLTGEFVDCRLWGR
jgi:hypothetical protein